jgi:hypothetical protein
LCEIDLCIYQYQNIYPNVLINNWNGETLVVNKDENTTGGAVLTPTVVAGIKTTSNNSNVFTGVAMGKVQEGEDTYYGLYGYKAGSKTFSIDSKTGDAYFKGNGEFDGKIIAKEGFIGGWTIPGEAGKEGYFYNYNEDKGHAIAFSLDAVGQDTRCFKIGKFDPNDSSWGDLNEGF